MNTKDILCVATHVSPTRGFGGPSVAFRIFLGELQRQGLKYTLLTTCPNVNYTVTDQKNYVEVYSSTRMMHALGFSIKHLFKVLTLSHGAKVIIINGITTLDHFAALVFSNLYNVKKVVVFSHGSFEFGRTSHWNFIKRTYFRLNLYLVRRLDNKSRLRIVYQSTIEKSRSEFNNFTNQVVVGNFTKEQYKKEFIPHPRIYDFIYVGRISPEKGADRLLDFIEYVDSKSLNCQICCIIDSESDECTQLFSKFHGNRNIHIEYNLANDAVHRMLGKSKYLLFPSYVENYGNVLIEAVSNYVIPIVTDDTHWKDLLYESKAIRFSDLKKFVSEGVFNYSSEDALHINNYVYKKYIENNSYHTVIKWIKSDSN